MKPRIAIPVPTTTDLDYNRRSWPAYADAVRQAGGEPVLFDLTADPGTLFTLAEACHGICLPGSPADVDPTRYGAERDPATAPADPAREAVDSMLLEEAEAHGIPVLAICFGTQFVNAWRGGPLVQDVTPMPVNHSAGKEVAIAHTVLVAKDSLLGSLVDKSEATEQDGFLRLPVNTSHHQAVSAPGDGLRVSARCPDDGVIEAIESDPEWAAMVDEETGERHPWFLLGVQWHPERSTDISATSRAIFRRLVQEATLYAGFLGEAN